MGFFSNLISKDLKKDKDAEKERKEKEAKKGKYGTIGKGGGAYADASEALDELEPAE